MKTLAVLFGGQSTEHEISDLSACFVAENLDETKYELMMIGITKDGRWFWDTGPVDAIRCHTWQDDAENLVPCVVSPCSAHHGLLLLDKAAGTFAVRRVDVVFPVLHGKNGEDGTVQGLLTLAGIPYVGCDTYASAVCMNKIATKRLCAGLGISMAASVELTAGPDFDMNAAVCAAEEKLGYPVFVKPANAGSSVGITKARSRAELIAGIEKAFENDREVCKYIAERNCAVKYKVVMQDERESGLREILYLGHTVGRAIETVSDYRLLHGEAVSIGLVAQARLGEKLGFISHENVLRVESLLQRAGLPTAIPEYIDRVALIKKLYTDKKVRDGKLRFVFQHEIGEMEQFGENQYGKEIAESEIAQVIGEM